MSEFNLSEKKRFRGDGDYFHKDVKEFIRLLKEELKKQASENSEERDRYCIGISAGCCLALQEIDKIAGSNLIESKGGKKR